MTWGGAAVARVTHNHKVAGSSPAPTTLLTILDGPAVLRCRAVDKSRGDRNGPPGQITFNGVVPCSS